MVNKKSTFNRLWMKMDSYSWVSEDKSDKCSAYCTLCHKSFALSNMGVQALNSHNIGKKHKAMLEAMASSQSLSSYKICPPTNKPGNIIEEKSNELVSQSACCNKNQQTTVVKFFNCDEVTTSEILWALHVIDSHLSMSSGGKSIEIMKSMFPDSKIAQNITLQRNKLTYIIVYGLAKYFYKELEDDVLKSHCFSISFDESLNQVSQKEQMDICIHYWSNSKNEILSCYFSSAFLGKTTSVDLFLALKMQCYL